MRVTPTFAESEIVGLVSAYSATALDIEQSRNFLLGNDIPQNVRAATLRQMSDSEKVNASRAERLRNILKVAVEKMEPDNIVSFLSLEGVVSDVVDSANLVKKERKVAGIRRAIDKNSQAIASALEKAGVLPEIAATILNSQVQEALKAAGIEK